MHVAMAEVVSVAMAEVVSIPLIRGWYSWQILCHVFNNDFDMALKKLFLTASLISESLSSLFIKASWQNLLKYLSLKGLLTSDKSTCVVYLLVGLQTHESVSDLSQRWMICAVVNEANKEVLYDTFMWTIQHYILLEEVINIHTSL